MSAGASQPLDRAFAGGLAWTAGVKYLTQGVTWIALIITAKLLTPADFGLSEMAAVFVVITSTLAEFGVGTAVLQMQELEGDRIRQMHTFSCLVAFGFFLLALLATPLMTAFFKQPGLELLFAANSIAFLITGFQAVPVALIQRDLDYRRLAIAEAAQVIIQAIGTVAAASAGFSYWSLTAGAAAGKISAAVIVNFWKPIAFIRIRWQDIRGAVHLGGQVSIGRLAWSAYIQADGIIVGRILGQTPLGVYRMAMNLAAAPAEKTSSLLMRATGPLFAKVQNDLALVRRYFLIMFEVLLLSLLPLLLGLFLVAREAVLVVLGPQWLPAVEPLRWLALYMTFRPLATLAEQVLISQRRTRFTMVMSIFNFCVLPVAFYVAGRWLGTAGVASVWLFLVPVVILPGQIKLFRTIHLPWTDLAQALWAPATAAASMFPVVWLLRQWVEQQGWPPLWGLGLEVAAGGLVYGAVLLLFFRHRLERYIRFAKELRKGAAPASESVA